MIYLMGGPCGWPGLRYSEAPARHPGASEDSAPATLVLFLMVILYGFLLRYWFVVPASAGSGAFCLRAGLRTHSAGSNRKPFYSRHGSRTAVLRQQAAWGRFATCLGIPWPAGWKPAPPCNLRLNHALFQRANANPMVFGVGAWGRFATCRAIPCPAGWKPAPPRNLRLNHGLFQRDNAYPVILGVGDEQAAHGIHRPSVWADQ